MAKSSGSTGLGLVIGLFLASIFTGLILSVWAYVSKKKGRSYGLQLFFGIIAIVVFGYFLSYNMFKHYSSFGDDVDVILQCIGLTGIVSNTMAAVFWTTTLFQKST